ncbi:MAG: hypothetical protein RLZ07_1558 [Pseudomonadota bacterium]
MSEAPKGRALFNIDGETLIARAIGAADRIEAHCLFNLAAAQGVRDAIRLRKELAAEMTSAEIALAQRRARAYIGVNP